MAAPIVTAAISYTLNRVRVFFSEPMTNLGTAGNFSIAGLVVTLSTPSADRFYTDLTTTGMVTGDPYTVVVSSPPVQNDTLENLADNDANFLGAISPGDAVSETPDDGFVNHGEKTVGGDSISISANDARKTNSNDFLSEFFHMRAFRALTPGYVYWTVANAPDFAGNSSGYPTIELSDIVLISTC